MLGFKSVPSARRYCRGYDELRNFLALVLACANTFPPLRGGFTTCAGQPSLSVCWKVLEPGLRSPGICCSEQARKLTEPAQISPGANALWLNATKSIWETRPRRRQNDAWLSSWSEPYRLAGGLLLVPV